MALRSSLRKLYHYLRAVPKSLLFNFYYLPFNQAIRLPLVVSHRVRVERLQGRLLIPKQAKTGKIRFGFGQVQVASPNHSPFVWSVGSNATIRLGERVKIGTGCKLHIDGEFTVNERTNFTGECTVICKKAIKIGGGGLISWQTLLMDSDFHPIVDSVLGTHLNPDSPISIGNNVWIGARTSVNKGVSIGSNTVVGAASHLTKSFLEDDLVLGGNPAKIIGSMENKYFTD